ncbi:hypothetical protein PsYK624_026100 [Phanerochaete sordida]|uniref:Uncharacterized protein n=1 Tax=Phanerochaete sordida TaxID=48140 RepID=A0A9P3L8W7_9APHY|nr:hypothetical protein PsYK624_026100 [Phanerochaete sordida]
MLVFINSVDSQPARAITRIFFGPAFSLEDAAGCTAVVSSSSRIARLLRTIMRLSLAAPPEHSRLRRAESITQPLRLCQRAAGSPRTA